MDHLTQKHLAVVPVRRLFLPTVRRSNGSVKLRTTADESRTSLSDVDVQITTAADGLKGFDELLLSQKELLERIGQGSRDLERKTREFQERFRRQNEGYSRIDDSIAATSAQSESYARSAGILSELGTYLRHGGEELSRILGHFSLKEEDHSDVRAEERHTLLYNLEVFGSDGKTLGYLNDLSRSGLGLVSRVMLRKDQIVDLRIRLPAGMPGDRRDLSCRMRVCRSEPQKTASYACRAGGVFEDLDEARADVVGELLELLSVQTREDQLSALSDLDDLKADLDADDAEVVDDLEEL